MTVQLVQIEVSELERMLRAVVREELGKQTDIMTRSELAKHYGWSLSTIHRKIKAGLPHFGLQGEHPRFKKADVDAWLTAQKS